ncbi:methyl-accepting chemotaxis protein [Psychrobacillus sp. OK032]|uniref:methyl-accepting chemotaxis protein n=1 Tax=Psychrobacillus sp. OK032 TaxID=1884358 RepID=UPI0008C75F6D|nr:methyl-accepting chemotaxis protein [Psychrobacillus sp. OK032]SES35035.1 methyl-accepting chemotaxis sensory transducer with Pas/Pac sensor [Psychrobacillus sp. OK032]
MNSTIINANSTQVLDGNYVLSALESNLAMIEFDLNKKVIWVNENFAQTLGYTVEEMLNVEHMQFCTDEFRLSIEYEKLWANLKSGIKFQEKIQRVGKSGKIIWLEATYIPILTKDNVVEAVLKIATDITERENSTNEVISRLRKMTEELVDLVIANSNEKIKAIDSLKKQTDLINATSNGIRNISRQTNMVALNAAIEAARVGVHGLGFKVVADEVRRLSSNVDEAIKNVIYNVENIVEEVGKVSEVTEILQKSIIDTQSNFKKNIEEFEVLTK